MFKNGGAAGFPDLSGDGKVTQKDILMGRGVPMQMGGEPAMAQAQMGAMADPMAQAQMGAMADPMAQAQMGAMADPMAQAQMGAMAPPPAMAEGMSDMPDIGVGAVDPAMVESFLSQIAPSVGDPEQAGSVEEMMNMVRGDEASIQDRRMELASLVGEEDAMQTPESVLALVQPVVQIATIDQGIGGLAEQEMQEPVQGAMAGGIMSMMGG